MATDTEGISGLKNYSDSPLVTVQLMSCSKDVHLVPRAIASVVAQDLDPIDIQLQVLFDGTPTPEEEKSIAEVCSKVPFMAELLYEGKASGYYCVARNKALLRVFGFYVAHMDADNEWTPTHLSGLLKAIRVPTEEGWPHFVYSRRNYVSDVEDGKERVSGPSALIQWNKETCGKLRLAPQNNFVDTGDFLIGRSALYELAARTGCVWNTDMRRFGDWDLVCRLAQAGIRGRAVNQITHLYHWTGDNLQTTRKLSQFVSIPEDIYTRMKREGKIVDNPENQA